MNKDDIIKLAREAGFNWPEIHTTTIEERLERFANLVAAAELRRLHRHELALQCWLDKTNWVQETAQDGELGMHRADALKKRIEKLEAINQELLAVLKEFVEWIEQGDVDDSFLAKARAAINKAERTTT